LINPDTAQRCDCGYDFETRTVKTAYVTGRPPHSLYLYGAWIFIWFRALAFLTVGGSGPWRSIGFIAWVAIILPLYYEIIARRKRWASTALAVLTMPWGLWVLSSQQLRVFLLQPTIKKS
jgi:hypothetical protein